MIKLLYIAVILYFYPTQAFSHSWFDKDCCSGLDCKFVDDIDVIQDQTTGLYIIKGVKADKSTKIRPSQDGYYYWCRPFDRIVCIYVPLSG